MFHTKISQESQLGFKILNSSFIDSQIKSYKSIYRQRSHALLVPQIKKIKDKKLED